ncbi:Unknown protein, partial [Striga hermonthica]
KVFHFILIMLNFSNDQMPPRREPDRPVVSQATVVAQFRDYHPEKFSGQGDPRIVDEWVQGLELIFKVMDCPDRYRVTCAQLQLTERQFLSLKQGTHSVDEYEREFTRLRAFVPDLVRTEAQRAQRFTNGLYPAVRHNIVGHGNQTYARTVSIAQEVDASIRREANRDRPQSAAPAQSPTAPPVPPTAAQPTKDQKRKGKVSQTDRRTRQRPQQIPQCPTCGRLHRGECHMGQDIFYYCHEPGYFANCCPKKLQQQPQQQQQPRQQAQSPPQQQQRGRQQARVYAVDQAEAEQHPGTMFGMLMLNDIPVFALFDTGATHTSISRQCLDAIRVQVSAAVDPLEVSLASGRKIVTSARATDLSLSIGGRILSTDAYVLEMREFDLILSMDWLT